MIKEIPLSRGKIAIVDEEDFFIISQHKWYYHPNRRGIGYAARRDYTGAKPRIIWMHREINRTPDGYETDHKNRNGLDNRRSNLETVTPSLNRVNQNYKNCTGLRGVQKERSRFSARIKINKKMVWLGMFRDKIEAAKAFDAKARELYGDRAQVNFRDDEDIAFCGSCGAKLEIVRPGKYQCPSCE